MFALLLAAAAAASPSPASTCTAADPAVTSVGSQLIKRRGAPDHYVISATVSNIGAQSQTPDIMQRIALVRNGVMLAPQSIPALDAGAAYKLAFAVDRPSAERSQPLTLTLRYQLLSGDAAHNACNRSNDEITKTF